MAMAGLAEALPIDGLHCFVGPSVSLLNINRKKGKRIGVAEILDVVACDGLVG